MTAELIRLRERVKVLTRERNEARQDAASCRRLLDDMPYARAICESRGLRIIDRADQRVLDACAALSIVWARVGNAVVVDSSASGSVALVLQAEVARRKVKRPREAKLTGKSG